MLLIAGHLESIIRILEFRWNARSCRASRHLDVMPPRSAARSFACAVIRSPRISLGRDGVVAGIVPVAAPLMYVVTNIVESKAVRRVAGHRLGPSLPALLIIRQSLRRFVSPGKIPLLQPAPGSALPFCFGW